MMRSLVPKLRFGEFSGEWEEKTIGDIGSFYYGKSAPKWSLSENAPTMCVRYGELYTKFGAMITETYSRTNIDPERLRFSKGGEILVPRVGERPEEFGKCCSYLPLKNIAIGEMISVFETKENPLFYTYYFRSLWAEFSKVVEGQNVKNLYYKELEPLRICQPSLPEQQKIANTLSSLDNLIEAQKKKVEALKEHKKGLMQQLFPREGEKEPKLRFEGFSGEWEEKRLGDVCEFQQGVQVDLDLQSKIPKDNYIKFLRIENYTQNSNDFRYVPLRLSNNKTISKDEVAIVRYGATAGFIGIGFDGVIANNLFKLLPKDILDNKYLYYYLKLEKTFKYFQSEMAGGAMPALNFGIVGNLSFRYSSKKEQQKIAKTLSSLDTLIEAQNKKIEALNKHKKGLMQQMFVSA